MPEKGLNNPALIAALAQNPELANGAKKGVKIASVLALTLVFGITGCIAYRVYKVNQRKAYIRDNAGKPDVKKALLLHKAMIGDLEDDSFFKSFSLKVFLPWTAILPNGTDEDTIFNTLKGIKDFASVSKAYEKISGRNLSADLQSELSASDYKKALNLIDIDTAFDHINNQTYQELTPYSKGDRIQVTNPQGAKVYGFKIINGIYHKKDVITTIPQGKTFKIFHTLNNAKDSRIHYVICRYSSWPVCMGDALINHRDVIKI